MSEPQRSDSTTSARGKNLTSEQISEALSVSLTRIINDHGISTAPSVDIIKNAAEALKYDGFNLEEWLKINTYRIKTGLASNPLKFEGQTLTLNDTLSLCVQVGLMRGNSSKEKLVNQTSSEGKALMTDLCNITKHAGRAPNSKKKYGRTEFTFLRSITAFPHFACAILDKHREIASHNDPYFDTHTLPWSIQHGSSYALTHKILGLSVDQKMVCFYACSAVAASISARVIPELAEDRTKFKARCSENEKYVQLQTTHPLYSDADSKKRILTSCVSWGVIKTFVTEDQVTIRLDSTLWTVANKYAAFMGYSVITISEK